MANHRVTTAEIMAWRTRYENGETIEEIALDTGRSPQTVRKGLYAAGTKMRKAQGVRSSRYRSYTREGKGKSEVVEHRHPSKTQRTGHRRRGF